jgi:hypothetical protein
MEDKDLWEYWRSNARRYPSTAEVAASILSISVMSALAERTVSQNRFVIISKGSPPERKNYVAVALIAFLKGRTEDFIMKCRFWAKEQKPAMPAKIRTFRLLIALDSSLQGNWMIGNEAS